MRFLIVDDSSTMRRIIINTLTKLGYESFLEAGNGREGLDHDVFPTESALVRRATLEDVFLRLTGRSLRE